MARPHRLSLAGGGLALLLLAGCGDTPLADALRGPAGPAQAAAGPGSSGAETSGPVLLVTGARRPFRFTLLQEAGGQRLWRAEGGAALSTQGARITATAGLGAGLAATRLEGADPLEDLRGLPGREVRSLRSIDLQGATRSPEDLRFGVQLACRMTAEAEGGWLVATERCTGDDIDFTNRFWAEAATGVVRRSEQWVGDSVLTVEGHGL